MSKIRRNPTFFKFAPFKNECGTMGKIKSEKYVLKSLFLVKCRPG
jgi:hypothetical protein